MFEPFEMEIIMEQVIKKIIFVKLRESSLISLLRSRRLERPAPRSQAEIDRLPRGWERDSESTRARMARIGI
jgi:hypothetical protein